eukprot:238008-Rhodomonas_salina.3
MPRSRSPVRSFPAVLYVLACVSCGFSPFALLHQNLRALCIEPRRAGRFGEQSGVRGQLSASLCDVLGSGQQLVCSCVMSSTETVYGGEQGLEKEREKLAKEGEVWCPVVFSTNLNTRNPIPRTRCPFLAHAVLKLRFLVLDLGVYYALSGTKTGMLVPGAAQGPTEEGSGP